MPELRGNMLSFGLSPRPLRLCVKLLSRFSRKDAKDAKQSGESQPRMLFNEL